ncbi:hypothetical protein DICVIV_07110 [Dictyocaulus viviparus]|uniref:Uncharacterized protein n=1 Tax=Dictyocaulus viviparus TaxID=29172 RepID=A0A0D8XQQ7_DICVI|nr:hypothetical protein DICVIV_07110 [Dictyocaulus viviparus]
MITDDRSEKEGIRNFLKSSLRYGIFKEHLSQLKVEFYLLINLVQKATVHEIDKKQMDIARAKMKKQKDERAVAKQEEKNWVEFRKLQVLYDCRPKSRGTFRRDDDSFPRRRRGVSMGFGERKAYFLSIRPNPRYATWFGKKKNWQNKEKTKKDKDKKKSGSKSDRDASPKQEVFCVPVPTEGQKPEDSPIDDTAEENITEKKGNHALNPLVRGIPFWITPEEGEEPNEDDLPIDRELIEKVLDGTFNIASNSLARKNFDPFSEVESYKKLDKFFTRTKKLDKEERVITWGQSIYVSIFDVSKRNTKKMSPAKSEPMRNIVREAVEKKL